MAWHFFTKIINKSHFSHVRTRPLGTDLDPASKKLAAAKIPARAGRPPPARPRPAFDPRGVTAPEKKNGTTTLWLW